MVCACLGCRARAVGLPLPCHQRGVGFRHLQEASGREELLEEEFRSVFAGGTAGERP